MAAMRLLPGALEWDHGRPVLRFELEVAAPVVFYPHVRIALQAAGQAIEANSAATTTIGWLPRGRYLGEAILPAPWPAGNTSWRMEAWHRAALKDTLAHEASGRLELPAPYAGAHAVSWRIESIAPAPPLAELSWRKGHADWFFRHFDHAAQTVTGYMLGDSPLLSGRILDVGCGDGITDLGIALRTGCAELVGIDPFKGYERLPGILAANHLPADAVPANLRFLPESANTLPFADDTFDVVISWGSLEHIAGGYDRALREIRRVLRPDGLLFVHPGLYYSFFGHHLGEFSSEPHFHLKKPLEEIRRIVFETRPSYMDRAGEFSSPEQYWQWFRELNPITVGGFERELRALDFEPWRVAIRTQDLIEYTPELQRYPMQDLATNELYLSCVSRKGRR
jgi:SAM-dependent methyltransferase